MPLECEMNHLGISSNFYLNNLTYLDIGHIANITSIRIPDMLFFIHEPSVCRTGPKFVFLST